MDSSTARHHRLKNVPGADGKTRAEKQAEYSRKYREENLEKARAASREYIAKKRAAMTEEEREADREASRLRAERRRRESGAKPRVSLGLTPEERKARKLEQAKHRRAAAGAAPRREAKMTRERKIHNHRTQEIPSDVRSAYKRAAKGSQIRRLYPTYEALIAAAQAGKFDAHRTQRADVFLPGARTFPS